MEVEFERRGLEHESKWSPNQIWWRVQQRYITNSITMRTLKVVFALARRRLNTPRVTARPSQLQIKEEQPTHRYKDNSSFDPQEYTGIDLNNFSYMAGLQNISLVDETKQAQWLAEVRGEYEANSFRCWQLVRAREEEVIHKLQEHPGAHQKMLKLIDLKMGMALKFRKYEQIVVDLSNQEQILRMTPGNDEISLLKVYHSLTAALIMSDHYKLHQLLKPRFKDHKRQSRLKRKTTQESLSGSSVFTKAFEQILSKQNSSQPEGSYCEAVLIQAKALLIVGEKRQALSKLCAMTQASHIDSSYINEVYSLILLAINFENQSQNLLPSSIQAKLQSIKPLSQQEAQKLCSCSISTTDSLSILQSLIEKSHQVSLEQLSNQIAFRPYTKLVFLLAQNLYLEGKQDQSFKLFEILKTYYSKFEDREIQTMCNYLKMGQLADSGDQEQWIQYFQQFRQADEKQMFYDPRYVGIDLIRVNFYRIAANMYRQKGESEKASELQGELLSLETALSLYTLKQPEMEQDELVTNWRSRTQQPIPYYYFNLHLEELFGCKWNESYSRI